MIGEWHAVTLSGSINRQVNCENCGFEYGYKVSRTVISKSFNLLFWDDEAANRAADYAENKLARELNDGTELVPCLKCGQYQVEMVPAARKRYYKGLERASVQMFVSAALILVYGVMKTDHARHESLPSWAVIGSLTLGAIALVVHVVRLIACKLVDPNEEREYERLELASEAFNKFGVLDSIPLEMVESLDNPLAAQSPVKTPTLASEFFDGFNATEPVGNLMERKLAPLDNETVERIRKQLTIWDVFWGHLDYKGFMFGLVIIGVVWYPVVTTLKFPQERIAIQLAMTLAGMILCWMNWLPIKNRFQFISKGDVTRGVFIGHHRQLSDIGFTYVVGDIQFTNALRYSMPIEVGGVAWVVFDPSDPRDSSCINDLLIVKQKEF